MFTTKNRISWIIMCFLSTLTGFKIIICLNVNVNVYISHWYKATLIVFVVQEMVVFCQPFVLTPTVFYSSFSFIVICTVPSHGSSLLYYSWIVFRVNIILFDYSSFISITLEIAKNDLKALSHLIPGINKRKMWPVSEFNEKKNSSQYLIKIHNLDTSYGNIIITT